MGLQGDPTVVDPFVIRDCPLWCVFVVNQVAQIFVPRHLQAPNNNGWVTARSASVKKSTKVSVGFVVAMFVARAAQCNVRAALDGSVRNAQTKRNQVFAINAASRPVDCA